jgi:hypothetical protein
MGSSLSVDEHGSMEPWVLPAVTVAFLALYFVMRNERVRRVLTCPVKHEVAEVELVQRYQKPEKPVRVTRCSLLADPSKVDCGQDCIHHPA